MSGRKELYRFIRGVRKPKFIVSLSLPSALYIVLKLLGISVKISIINVVILIFCVMTFIPALALIVMNIADRVKLRRDLENVPEEVLTADLKLGRRFLGGDVVVGERYIFARGSSRLFAVAEISDVFDDIREVYNIFTMLLSGSDDIVKTKIIKAEFYNKSFLHDRRICAVKVHKQYDSDIGITSGYDQLAAIENEIRERMSHKEIV